MTGLDVSERRLVDTDVTAPTSRAHGIHGDRDVMLAAHVAEVLGQTAAQASASVPGVVHHHHVVVIAA